jgi:hypothetical protein
MGHYARQCPKKKKKKQQDGTVATADEEEFNAQFARACAFVSIYTIQWQVGRQS